MTNKPLTLQQQYQLIVLRERVRTAEQLATHYKAPHAAITWKNSTTHLWLNAQGMNQAWNQAKSTSTNGNLTPIILK